MSQKARQDSTIPEQANLKPEKERLICLCACVWVCMYVYMRVQSLIYYVTQAQRCADAYHRHDTVKEIIHVADITRFKCSVIAF